MNKYKIVLLGNPNVGKSTIYNYLCKENQHTGNWAGKTVESASGTFEYEDSQYELIDLPGIYSLNTCSEEEEVSKKYLENETYDLAIVVVDAYVLERSILLCNQVLSVTDKVMIVINLYDEAYKRGMRIDEEKLNQYMKAPHILMSAKNTKDMEKLKWMMSKVVHEGSRTNELINSKELMDNAVDIHAKANDNRLDRILTHRIFGPLVMGVTLLVVLYLTIILANYPSEFLSYIFGIGEQWIYHVFQILNVSPWLMDLIINYIYRILSLVIAVMLPPMVIFFPLFSILESIGYLPRIAFNLDYYFQKVGASGKQALTICMGYGCNVVGVMGSRIIESPRERLLAILTNVFTPCNGRFPILITLLTLFIVTNATSLEVALYLSILLVFSLFLSFLMTGILRKLLHYNKQETYILELTNYRTPNFKQIIKDALVNKTFKIMMRAIYVVIPAALLIYVGNHITINSSTLLQYISSFLNPLGVIMGLDGVILLAFLIGIMANEVVLPLCLMLYGTGGIMSSYSLEYLYSIFIANNWNMVTAVCTLLFTIAHFPCINTIIAIYKETHSIRHTLISILFPTLTGILLCIIANGLLTFVIR